MRFSALSPSFFLSYFYTLAHNSQIRGEARSASNKPLADTYRGRAEEEITDAISQVQESIFSTPSFLPPSLPPSFPFCLSLSLSLSLSFIFPFCNSFFSAPFSCTGCCRNSSQQGMQLSNHSSQQGVFTLDQPCCSWDFTVSPTNPYPLLPHYTVDETDFTHSPVFLIQDKLTMVNLCISISKILCNFGIFKPLSEFLIIK